MATKEVDENLFLDEDYEEVGVDEAEEKPLPHTKKKVAPDDEVEEEVEENLFEIKEEKEE